MSALRAIAHPPAFTAALSGHALITLARTASERWPSLAERVRKAALLIVSGRVHRTGLTHAYSVSSQRWATKVYSVDTEACTCDCVDFQRENAQVKGQPVCKHLLAAMLIEQVASANNEGRQRIQPPAA